MENNSNTTPIENSLGLSHLDTISQLECDINKNSTITDFDSARANIKNILEIGSDAISDLGRIAFQSQDANTYIALSRLIKDVSDASTKLLDLHEKLENISNKKFNKTNKIGDEDNSNTVNLFFSTSDIFKVIKQMEEK